MKTRSPLVSLALATAVAAARAFAAEESPAPAQPPTPSSLPAPLAAPKPAPPRAEASKPTFESPARPPVSTALAGRITAVAPKFDPAVAAAMGKSPEVGVDLREFDKPKNTIVRLPDFTVQEDKIPAIKPREMITAAERRRLTYRKHPGLHFGSLPLLGNDGIAAFMAYEEERLERMKEMDDLLTLLPKSQQPSLRRAVDDSFARKELPR